MTDIVERLRDEDHLWDWNIVTEAADEIERLRAENARLRADKAAICQTASHYGMWGPNLHEKERVTLARNIAVGLDLK
jgi:hypothetical protein